MSTPAEKPYKLTTSALPFDTRPHPIDPSAVRSVASLGDLTGLTQLGVHLCRVAPHTLTTVLHWHNSDDEWIYVLDAGVGGATLLILPPGADAPVEEPLKTGDFLGFAAGRRDAHACRAGETELVYLVGGTRKEIDVCVYPAEGKKLVVDRTGKADSFFLDNASTMSWGDLVAAQKAGSKTS